jgi:hypothetical protein
LLREDLKNLKADHFRRSYEKQLTQPQEFMERVHFKGDNLDAFKYFQLKYFLSEEARSQSMKNKVAEITRAGKKGKAAI